jgi:hypothetical protein
MTCRKYDMPNYEKVIQSKDNNVSDNPTGQRVDIPNTWLYYGYGAKYI